jgi:ATP-dependent DNA helicase RecG
VSGSACPAGARRCSPSTSRLRARRSSALNAYRTPAQRRLVFEEFFRFQVGLLLRKRESAAERKVLVTRVDDAIRESMRKVLPFRLTAGQREALKEIGEDMQRPWPMNRLLQGDVGAGKTIVAVLAAVLAMENGQQVAFMAPTEILAEQHFGTLQRLLAGTRFRVGLLTGTLGAGERRSTTKAVAAGEIHLVVGTHALVQRTVRFHALGLVVIDEQHRFGVLQRATLRAKGLLPDMLVMTATPIPRTLALTTYGDLDVSAIRDLPPGRTPVRTAAKPESRRDEIYAFLRSELGAGRQAYVVYPIIEESEKTDLRAATEMADHLAADVFPELRVALLHGRMDQAARDRVMRAFAAGDIDLLVATTVVEVGIDVPNATVMVVEHAERFGLSQLHQLRGRVGRGTHRSSCVLIYQYPLTDEARERLKVMTETTDGFVIAEKDLELRGPGDVFGTRQAGAPTLRVGDLLRDHALMEDARREASGWLDAAATDPEWLAEFRRTWGALRYGLHRSGMFRVRSARSCENHCVPHEPSARRSNAPVSPAPTAAAAWRLLPGKGCGRRRTSCGRHCSTSSPRRCRGRGCWMGVRAPGPWGSRRSAGGRRTSRSSTVIGGRWTWSGAISRAAGSPTAMLSSAPNWARPLVPRRRFSTSSSWIPRTTPIRPSWCGQSVSGSRPTACSSSSTRIVGGRRRRWAGSTGRGR